MTAEIADGHVPAGDGLTARTREIVDAASEDAVARTGDAHLDAAWEQGSAALRSQVSGVKGRAA